MPQTLTHRRHRRRGERPNKGAEPASHPRPAAIRAHYLNRVGRTTVAKYKNTLILPGDDVEGDVRAINDGLAVRNGASFTVNGRTYTQEPNGALYPDHGEGFISLDRSTMQALKILARYIGPTPQAEHQIATDPNLSEAHRDAALVAWQLGRKPMR